MRHIKSVVPELLLQQMRIGIQRILIALNLPLDRVTSETSSAAKAMIMSGVIIIDVIEIMPKTILLLTTLQTDFL